MFKRDTSESLNKILARKASNRLEQITEQINLSRIKRFHVNSCLKEESEIVYELNVLIDVISAWMCREIMIQLMQPGSSKSTL